MSDKFSRNSMLSTVLDSSSEFRFYSDEIKKVAQIYDIADIIPKHPSPNSTIYRNISIYYDQVIRFMNQVLIFCIILHYIFGNRASNDIISFTDMEERATLNHKLMELEKKYSLLIKILDDTLRWRMNIENHINSSCPKNVIKCANIDNTIREALDLYDADKVGMIDYALASGGASIVSTPNTRAYPSMSSYSFFGLINVKLDSNPRLLIQPGTFPGECFAFFGSSGRIKIKLSDRVKITAVTLEHTYQNLTNDVGSCPKKFRVHGFYGEEYLGHNLGEFTYNIQGKTLQTFPILKKTYKKYNYVELEILTNHGNEEYTCIYRFRVHGLKT